MPKCLVKNCPHKTGNKTVYPNVVLHVFPRHLERIKTWLRYTGQSFEDFDGFAQKIFSHQHIDNYRICSEHFSENSYYFKGNRKLLCDDAIPTVLLDNTLKVSESWMTKRPIKVFIKEVQPSTSTSSSQPCQCNCHHNKISTSNQETQTDPTIFNTSQETQIPEVHAFDYADAWTVHKDHSYAGQFTIPDVDHSTPHKGKARKALNLAITPIPLIRKPVPMEDSDDELLPIVTAKEERDEEIRTSSIHRSYRDDLQTTFDNSAVLTAENISQDASYFPDTTPSETSFLIQPEETSAHQSMSFEEKMVDEKKFIVFESCLDNLIRMITCQSSLRCTARIEHITKRFEGTLVKIHGVCFEGHNFPLWQSQPMVKNIAAGNLLLASSIVLSGSSFQKVHDLCNILGLVHFSECTFYRYQRRFVFPVIDLHWMNEKSKVKEKISGKALCVGGDGQSDSPGYSAKYCVYTLIDLTSKNVIDFEVVQVTQCSSSQAMEKLAFETCFNRVLSEKFEVHILATDRHPSIRKVMQDKYNKINHQFDVWHYAKSLREKIAAASKKRSKGNEEDLKEKWQSVLYHVQNKHNWRKGKKYHKCVHAPLSKEEIKNTNWLDKLSPAYANLQEIVINDQIDKDLKYLTYFCHTGILENYNSMSLKFRSKRIHFGIDSMEARTKLAALTHNFNVGRQQAVVTVQTDKPEALVKKRTKMEFRKCNKRWTVRNVYETMSIEHFSAISTDIIRMAQGKLSTAWISRAQTVPVNIASVPRPDKQEKVREHSSISEVPNM
ncbi:hypothetical protein XELAEV_18039140mg [Xenopus laevis]|uniref:THAP-type domain-containing protein n=1 Tax=Xenopus laevis TaxID=8355 RepID=A0A974C843_XENLA|nr:hypothetical protein XELAEV_18039140mg [Xenopus laevis]